jgi:hypothetical protein
MKKFTVNAYSLEEAKNLAEENGLKIVKNVTQSWKNAKCPIEGRNLEVFCTEALSKNGLAGLAGAGLVIAVAPGSKDTRERPYKFVNNVVEGKRKTQRVIKICLTRNDEVVGTASKKSDAEKLAKELMVKYREDMYAQIVYEVKDGKDIAFELKYAPSTSAKKGTYVVFGTEASSF